MTGPPPAGGRAGGGLPYRIRERFRGPRWSGGGLHLLVALSGGLDSLVLLHLLRFRGVCPGATLTAAHFDHGMREESRKDACWVRGLCSAWGVPLVAGRSSRRVTSEDEAREARYAFLLDARERVGAGWILTGHQADDQAETVLFRILRGTGLRGLAGIPARRPPGIYRPLLEEARGELEAYARKARIRPREDPSNAGLHIPRNLLRHRTLPQVEAGVAPGARKALVRLARRARENEAAWESLIPGILEALVREEDRGILVVRTGLLTYHPAVRGRLVRTLLGREGCVLDEAGTRAVLEFTSSGASGRSLDLPGGLRISREFDHFLLERAEEVRTSRPLAIQGVDGGEGEVVLAGTRYRVRWGGGGVEGAEMELRCRGEILDFPLLVRARQPGDRISLSYGSKKLKKLLGERGVPVGLRDTLPVLTDARGRILWVPGVAESSLLRSGPPQASFTIGIDHAD